MNSKLIVIGLALIGLCGCTDASSSGGTEASARAFYDSEFRKWVAGQETDIATMKSRLESLKSPISYDIRSVVPAKPDVLAIAKDFNRNGASRDSDGEWVAWKFNVAIEWESRAGTPVTKIATYTLTWNPRDKNWFVTERH